VLSKEIDNQFIRVSNDVLKVQESPEESKKRVIEDKDRESRGNNIVIYRMPEGNTNEETNANDKAFCLELA